MANTPLETDAHPLLKLEGVGRRFQMGQVAVDALKDVSIEVQPGEFLVMVGPSGSGKSMSGEGGPRRESSFTRISGTRSWDVTRSMMSAATIPVIWATNAFERCPWMSLLGPNTTCTTRMRSG